MSRRRQNKDSKTENGVAIRTATIGKTSFVPPIHSLVPDVLLTIFAQALLKQVEADYRSDRNRLVPLNVSTVCHKWRAIVLASPFLWSTIKWWPYLKYPGNHFNLFLRRSEQAPLDISIKLRDDSHYELLSSVLHDNQTRLRNVEIDLGSVIRMFNNYGILKDSPRTELTLSNLTVVENFRFKLGRFNKRIFLKLKYAPFLRCLRLEGNFSLSLDADLTLPNLTTFELSSNSRFSHFSLHDCVMLLQASPSIEEFSVSGIGVGGQKYHIPRADGKFVCLSRLSTFSITEVTDETVRFILGALTLPGVKKLVIHVDTRSVPSACGVHSFLERSNAVLETLDLCIPSISEFTQCLESSLDLQILVLNLSGEMWSIGEANELLRHLTLNSGARMCPRLRKIVFYGCNVLHGLNEVTAMIRSWWNRSTVEEGNSLEIVEFHRSPKGRAVALQLNECCKGLNIIVDNVYKSSYSDEDYSDEAASVEYYSTDD